VASLDKAVGDEGDAALGDLVAHDPEDVEESVTVSLGEDALHRAVEMLPERERLVIKLRYGLDGDPDPKSLEEISRVLGVTRERVRQIEAKALSRLALERELESIRAA
jgi:RNA polymerase primary sigma factor